MRLRLILTGALAALVLATPAAAEPPRAALRLYASGSFLAAAETAERQNSPSSLAFAARAFMAECLTSSPTDSDIDMLISRAENAAREALALDPRSVDARLQLALAIGARGRRASVTEAISHGYARQGRRLIDDALTLDPQEPWAHALLGGWHLEVLRRGGRAGAIAYGARLNSGIAAFDRARELAPSDPLIALHYAVALLELDPQRYEARVETLLAAIAAMPARDAFETHAIAQARRLAAAMERSGPQAAQAVAREAFL